MFRLRPNRRARAAVVAALLGFTMVPALLFSSPASAATGCTTEEFTWDGSSSSSWTVGANWDENTVPGASDNVCIPDATTTPNDPVISSAVSIDNFDVAAGGIASMTSGSLATAGQFAVSGTFTMSGSSTLSVGTTTVVGATPAALNLHGGNVTWGGGVSSGNGGLIDWTSGDITATGQTIFISGLWNINNTSTVTLTASTFTNNAGLDKAGAGTVNWNTDYNITSGHGMTVSAGSFVVGSSNALTQNGTVNIAAGTFSHGTGTYVNGGSATLNMTNSASVLTASAVTLTGTVNAKGTINGNTTVSGGTTNIAGGSDSYGMLTVNGTYTQSGGTVIAEVGGHTTPGTDYDRLVVSGAATLGGTFNIESSSFVPTHGGTITPVTYGSKTGTFTLTDDLAQWAWVPTYGSTNLLLTASGNPGSISGTLYEDVNGDGVKQGGETTAVPGWTVFVDEDDDGMLDADETHMDETDSNGAYSLTGLDPGTVDVDVVISLFGVVVTDAAGTGGDVSLSAGGSVTNENIGLYVAPEPESQDPASQGTGYWMVGVDGNVYPVGDGADDLGNASDLMLNSPVVGMAPTPTGAGYWLVAEDGGVFNYGDAEFYGSAANVSLNAPIVGIAATPYSNGYWLVGADGGVFNYGSAEFYGSAAGLDLAGDIVGIVSTPTGNGYWLVAEDGGVFSFGDATFYGSMAGRGLNGPVIGIATAPGLDGYWLVAQDGGVFAFGDAEFHGSAGGLSLEAPIVNIRVLADGSGYWLFSADGGAFAYGNATYMGNAIEDLTDMIIG